MRKPYKTDLSDEQWKTVKPLLPPALPGGRPCEVNLREVLNTLLYQARTGCQWDMLPHDLLPKSTVSGDFAPWRDDGTWQRIVDALRRKVRTAAGREPTPRVGSIDSQTVKATEVGGVRGYDGGQWIDGRKRPMVVDSLRMLMVVRATAASADDGTPAPPLWKHLDRQRFPRLETIWGDRKYRNKALAAWLACSGVRFRVAVVTRPPDSEGFVKLPKRWASDDTQATVTLEPVKQQEPTVSVSLPLQVRLLLPPQDEPLPHVIEAHVHRVGLEVQRALFRALIEHAGQQLVLSRRGGKDTGIQLRGTRPFHFKTIFGTVAVQRLRISHRRDGSREVPSTAAWGTSHRCQLTRGLREALCDQMLDSFLPPGPSRRGTWGLREALCDQMLDESAGAVHQDVCQAAGEPALVCRSTVLNVVHQEGATLLEATRAWADDVLRKAAETSSPVPVRPAEGPPVRVERDEVKVKAPPHTGRREIWLFTAVVRLLEGRQLLVDTT